MIRYLKLQDRAGDPRHVGRHRRGLPAVLRRPRAESGGADVRRAAGHAARLAQIKHDLHLDLPLYLQYLHWVGNLLQGNLGFDYYKGQSVNSVVAAALPATISLVLGAAILWIGYGVISGVVSAVRPRTLIDRASRCRRWSSTRCRRSCSASR